MPLSRAGGRRRIEHVYESGGGSEATGRLADVPVIRGQRPWLAEDGCFQDVVASLPGGSTLAQVLPTLLTLEPASLVAVDPTALLAEGSGSPVEWAVEGGDPDEGGWPAVSDECEWSPGAYGVSGSAEVAGLGEKVGSAEAWGPGDGLPVWLTALQQCLEPLPAVANVPAAVGSAPVRSGPVPAGGLVDAARVDRQEDRAAEALASMSTAAVIEVVAGFKRIEAWAASQAARAAAR